MTDYLAGLVGRATGTAPPLRPRVPALFEPAGFGVSDARTSGDAAAEVQARSEPPQPLESRSERRVVESRGDEAARPAERRPEVPLLVAPAPVIAERAVAAPAPVREQQSAEVASPASPKPARTVAPVERVAVPGPPEPTPAQRAQPVVRAAAPERRAKPEPVSRAERAVQTTVGDAPVPDVHRRERLDEGDRHALRPKTTPALVSDAPAVRNARRSGPPSGPTLVHVSIGRVDVRAPGAPSRQPPVRNRPKPPTALDDYLGRRNGTRR